MPKDKCTQYLEQNGKSNDTYAYMQHVGPGGQNSHEAKYVCHSPVGNYVGPTVHVSGHHHAHPVPHHGSNK